MNRSTLAYLFAPLLLLASCDDGDAATAGDEAGEASMAYQDISDGSLVYLSLPNGTGRRPLAADLEGGPQTNPDWSPDGDHLVFANHNGTSDDLWVVDTDGSNLQLLLACSDPCVYLDDPAWSPDGTKVLYSRLAVVDGAGVGSLETVDVDSGDVLVLLQADPSRFFAGPRWSPDGSAIVLEHVFTDGSIPFDGVTGVELAVVDMTVDPPTVTAITDSDMFAATADWSPDGKRIAFSAPPSTGAEGTELFTISPDGGDLTQVTEVVATGGTAEHPDFTNDSSSLVFVGVVDEARTPTRTPMLARVDLATGEITPALGSYITGAHPRTRPTG